MSAPEGSPEDGQTVAEAIAAFQRRSAGAIQPPGSRWLRIAVGPLVFPVPDPGWMAWHDAHHVALAAGTDLRGEARVSIVDLQRRPPSPLIALLSAGSVGIALICWPRWTLAEWRRARGRRTLYHVPLPTLMAMTVAEARAEMGEETGAG